VRSDRTADDIHDIVQANTHRNANRAVLFFWVADDERRGLDSEEFWRILAHALPLCGAKVLA